MRYRYLVLIVLTVPWLVGWFHVLSEEAYFAANPNLTLEDVREQPDWHRGEVLILGGRVVDSPSQEAASTLEVLCFPTDDVGKPQQDQPDCGRFLVRAAGLPGPDRFSEGKTVTLSGEFLGLAEGGIPVFSPREVYLWEPKRQRLPAYPYYDPWYDPWRWPRWHDPWYGPYGPGWRGGLWYGW